MEYGAHYNQPAASGGYASGGSTSASSPNYSTTSSGSVTHACTYCYEHKRRCAWDDPDGPCRRCRWSRRTCVPRERAPRRAQEVRFSEESVIADLAEVNQEIDQVLERYVRVSSSRRPFWETEEVLNQLTNVPSTHVPTDNARAAYALQSSPQDTEYWREGPSSNLILRGLINERGRVPDILLNRIISPREANELFERFMQFWNHGLNLLDPSIHSPRTLLKRCPLLFTVVLAIASRDFPARPDLHQHLLQQAKLSATAALTDGVKAADTVQALLLMASYPPPVQRITDDRTSLFVGMAIRMAVELRLNEASVIAPSNHTEAIELANHTRTWRACLLLDGWTAVKNGRTPTLCDSRYEIQFPDLRSLPRDLESLRIDYERRIFKHVNEFMQLAKGVPDCMNPTRNFSSDIQALEDEIHHVMQRAGDRDQHSGILRSMALTQTIEYARMAVYSFGFTSSLRQGQSVEYYILLCMKAASASVQVVLNQLAMLPSFKYSPDGWFEYAAFSAAFLLKLLQPQFHRNFDQSRRELMASLVKRLVDMYRSPAVALLAENHHPRMLAQFLESVAVRVPEYAAAGAGPRGLSRSSRNTPSPPRIEGSGFDTSPEEALLNALAGVIPQWLQEATLAITGPY